MNQQITSNMTHAFLSASIEKVYQGLSMTEFESPEKIAKKIGFEVTGMSSHLSQLRKLGLAEHCESDRKHKPLDWIGHSKKEPLNPPQEPLRKRKTKNPLRDQKPERLSSGQLIAKIKIYTRLLEESIDREKAESKNSLLSDFQAFMKEGNSDV